LAKLTDATFERAVEVLRSNSTKWGVKASASYYNQVWARDSFISFLGSNMLEDVPLLSSCRRTIDTLAKTRSPLGQIADFYNPDAERAEFGFSGATDSSTWYIIGLLNLFHYTESRSLLGEPLDAALEAYRWLRYQDANNTWLIDSPPGADWMDAAIRRTGKTLYNNILFLMATRAVNHLGDLSGKKVEPVLRLDEGALSRRLSEVFLPSKENCEEIEKYWPYLASRVRDDPPEPQVGHYAHFVSFSKLDMHFDTLSNLLCVLAEVAPDKLRHSIIQTIKSRGLPTPYPVRVLDPPYQEGDDAFDVEFNKKIPRQHRSDPYDYHNGAVWPFVGGFYVISLQRSRDDAATSELLNLAKANSVFRPNEKTGFNEWLNGRSGEPLGQIGQSWSAGTYIAAYLSSNGKDPFRFVKP
jgi:glycogen debranching enzyme